MLSKDQVRMPKHKKTDPKLLFFHLYTSFRPWVTGRAEISDVKHCGFGSHCFLQSKRSEFSQQLVHLTRRIVKVSKDPGISRTGLNTTRQFAFIDTVIAKGTFFHDPFRPYTGKRQRFSPDCSKVFLYPQSCALLQPEKMSLPVLRNSLLSTRNEHPSS